MTCPQHLCMGRCGTPWECQQNQPPALQLHRVTLSPEEVTRTEYEEALDEPTALSWALFIVVCVFAVAIVVLPFVLG